MMQIKIAEVRNQHTDDDNYTHIDVYETADDNEEGKTVAIVCNDTRKVFFLDNLYRNEQPVTDAINEVLAAARATTKHNNYLNFLDVLHTELAPNWDKFKQLISDETALTLTAFAAQNWGAEVNEDPTFSSMDLDEYNSADLRAAEGDNRLVGLVDETQGGIVAYILTGHEERLVAMLNHADADMKKAK